MTNKVRTCVYAISLNEIKHVDSFMESCKEADLVLVCDSVSWGEEPFDHAALAAYHLGMYEQAVAYGQEALDMNPTSARLLTNLAFYEQALTK